MSGCERYLTMISCMIDGELSGAELEELEEHLETCGECRALTGDFTRIAGGLAADPAEPPKTLAEGAMYKVGREAAAGPGRKWTRKIYYGRYTAAAAVLAVVILAASLAFNRSTKDATGASMASEPRAGAYAVQELDRSRLEATSGTEAAPMEGSPAASADAAEQPARSSKEIAPAPEETPATGGIAPGEEMGGMLMMAPHPSDGGMGNGALPEEPGTDVPTLPYSDTYYAILVIYGGVPDKLKDCETERGSEGETYIFASAVLIDEVYADGADSGNYYIYRDEPNTDPARDDGIVVVY